MLKKIFWTILPQPINGWLKTIRNYKYVKRDNKLLQSKDISLEPKHIANLNIILTRDDLLKLLCKEAIVAEIGVDLGSFSKVILNTTSPKKLHLIDPWSSKRYPEEKFSAVNRLFSKEIQSGQVCIHRGYSIDQLEGFDSDYFDWVYLDSSHGYQSTLEELNILHDKVKKEGMICGHDYCRFSSGGQSRFGVVEAVNEFCLLKNYEFVYLTMETHRHLSFAIRAIPSEN
ncbi:MAG: class I SAM-dependent methyltransferase [Bacteroidota bacterium]